MQWKLEKRNIKDLKPFYKNARKLTKDQFDHLHKSLTKFGVIDKPIITTDNLIIGGHQRLQVLKKMGVKSIECYVPTDVLTTKEVEELNIRLNKNTGEWDFDILANQWELDKLLEWGFKQEDFTLNVDYVTQDEEDNDGVLEPTKDPKTKIGDVYTLDKHTLVCGDSTLPETVEKCLHGETPILMVTDPPYGVEYDPSWRLNIKEKLGKAAKALGKVKNDDCVNWSLAWNLFPGSVAYVWHSPKFSNDFYESLVNSEYQIISNIIWVKQHFVISRGDYHWQHEPCWYAVKTGHKHNWQGSRKESTVWEIANLNSFGSNPEDERTAHSTQKPLECMRRPIVNNTSEGEGVYDPFAGSGTTLIACEELKRTCFTIELDPAYCDIIVERWKKYRKKLKLSDEVILNGRCG